MLTPTLINKKQSECLPSENEKRRSSNRMRGYQISQAARKAKTLYTELNQFMVSSDCSKIDESELIPLLNLRRSLQSCCNHSLYRQFPSNGAIEYVASKTCKHKLCPVCNKERQRMVRSKYYKFFEGGKMHFPKYLKEFDKNDKGHIKRNAKGERTTKRVIDGYETKSTSDYNFMHLTLTVPHDENGFRGERFYATELMKEFNYMRKKAFWKKMVLGGEFGCEVTSGENGLHVHIHALLIVHKSQQNRNVLYRKILSAWNSQTVSLNAKRKEFTEIDIIGLKKSLGYRPNSKKVISSADQMLLSTLNPAGSTFSSLENLYIYSKKKLSGFDKWNAEKQSWKHYVDSNDPKKFLAGIMETIKYHFEPVGLQKHDGQKYKKKKFVQEVLAKEATEAVFDYIEGYETVIEKYQGIYNFDLIREILPKIYGKPLYRKFGALHGVDCLNINANVEDEMNESALEHARDEVVNPETFEADECEYFVSSATAVYFDEGEGFKPKISDLAKRENLAATTMLKALTEMINLSIRDSRKEKEKHKYTLPQDYGAFENEITDYKQLKFERERVN